MSRSGSIYTMHPDDVLWYMERNRARQEQEEQARAVHLARHPHPNLEIDSSISGEYLRVYGYVDPTLVFEHLERLGQQVSHRPGHWWIQFYGDPVAPLAPEEINKRLEAMPH